MNASFAKKMPPQGNMSIISQSGALGTAILDWSEMTDIGFANFVSFGNKADLNEIDFMQAWKEDKETNIILAYLESITRRPEVHQRGPGRLQGKAYSHHQERQDQRRRPRGIVAHRQPGRRG